VTDDRAHPDDDLACVEEVELITEYLEGALPAADVRRLEAHLEHCPGCTEYLAQMRSIAGSLGGLRAEQPVPPALRRAVLESFRERQP
jgi:anti-sigma factor RsiW